MKRYKTELSLLLVAALVLSSVALGFGQLSAGAADAAGTGMFRAIIRVRDNAADCVNNTCGTDSAFRLQFIDAAGNVVGATQDNAIEGRPEYSTYGDPLEGNQTTTYGSTPGAGGNIQFIAPSIGEIRVSRSISRVQLVNTYWEDDWYFDNVYFQYSADGGTTWVNITSGGEWKAGSSGAIATWNVSWFGANYKTLTFNANGGTGGGTYDAIPGQTITQPVPTRPGYAFTGWSPAVPARMPNANATYTAQWTQNNRTITFDANGGTGGTSQTLLSGSPLTPPAVARTGYTFVAWSPSVPATVPDMDKVYTAVWVPEGWSGPDLYHITFDPNGGSGTMADQLLPFGSTSGLSSNAYTKAGYTFLGWATSQPVADAGLVEYLNGANYTIGIDDTTLYAVWTPNSYIITFNANGGSGSTVSSMACGAVLTAPTVTKAGYNLTGWSPALPAAVPAADTTYTAQWTGNQYTVTFNAMGGSVSPASKTVTYNSAYGDLPTPTKPGYTFSSWRYVTPDGTDTPVYSYERVTITADQSVYAYWIRNTYTVAYNGNGSTGGSTASSSHTYGTAKALTANGFTKTGYAFAGWATSADGDVVYSEGQSVSNLSETSGATVTLYAKWTNVNVCTITFDANSGTGGKNTLMVIGSDLIAPTVAKTGYTLSGWSPALPSTVPAADTTYSAQWTARTFTVTFNPQSGTVSPTNSIVTYDSTYSAGTGGWPEPVRTGYTFSGWFTSTGGAGTQILSNTTVTITAAQTLYAKWTANQYTITFDANGGMGGTSGLMTYATALTAPAVTREGYTLFGWSPAVPSTVPAANTTYTAYWGINVTITFDANGGTGGTSTVKGVGTALTAPTVTRTGYTFLSWSPTVPATVPAENTTYTAQWVVSSPSTDFTYTVSNSEATITKYNGPGGNVVVPDTLDGYPVTAIIGKAINYYTFLGAFSDCPYPTVVTLPNTIKTIREYAFMYCTGVSEVKIPDSVTSIAGGAFCGCTGLAKVNIPSSITTIHGQTFYKCSSLTEVDIPGSVTSIEQNAFNLCSKLISAYFLGNAPTSVGTSVFGSCASGFTVYHLSDKSGFTSPTWYGYPTAVISPPGQYTITFYANGGTGGTSNSMNAGDPLTAPAVTKTGYTFTGWSPSVPATVSEANTTFTAQWMVNSYTITFDANGGAGGTSASMAPGSTLTAPTVSRTGYTFTGWSPAVPATVPAVDTTYTAQWSQTPSLVPPAESTAVIDNAGKTIYGLAEGLSQADFESSFVSITGNGRLEITITPNGFGTGTKVELIDNATNEVTDTWYIVIFGDVNGDGLAGTIDADLIYNYENYLVEWDPETEAYLFEAGDLNGDGLTGTVDADIIYNCENYIMWIDQTTGTAIEY